jgi:hypothetical protein
MLAIELPAETVFNLARSLSDAHLEELPINLYASVYTDFSVQVLAHRKSIQARDFAGLRAGSHGGLQERFDALVEELSQLHEEVLVSGRPVSPDH